jgi:DNA polymerase
VHGKPQRHTIAGLELMIYPIYHPAAGLRSQAMLTTLSEDFERLPELLAAARPEPEPEPEPPQNGGSAESLAATQLGLFG